MRLRACSILRPWLLRATLAGVAMVALLGSAGSLRAEQAKTPAAIQVAQADGAKVTIDNFAFNPDTLTIPAGTTVTWTNEDDMVHTVTEANRSFSSKGLETGDAFSHTFAMPGTYAYYCALHPKMTGTIIVK